MSQAGRKKKARNVAVLAVVDGESTRLAVSVPCPHCCYPVKPILRSPQNGLQRPLKAKKWLIPVICPACRSEFDVDADTINLAD